MRSWPYAQTMYRLLLQRGQKECRVKCVPKFLQMKCRNLRCWKKILTSDLKKNFYAGCFLMEHLHFLYQIKKMKAASACVLNGWKAFLMPMRWKCVCTWEVKNWKTEV